MAAMSRCATPTVVRGTSKCRTLPRQEYPRSGTRTRALLDYLMEHKGRPLALSWRDFFSRYCYFRRAIADLNDYWGMDIRRVAHMKGFYVLCGEWHGKVYVDYVAEKLDV
jgi:hypothetical protein